MEEEEEILSALRRDNESLVEENLGLRKQLKLFQENCSLRAATVFASLISWLDSDKTRVTQTEGVVRKLEEALKSLSSENIAPDFSLQTGSPNTTSTTYSTNSYQLPFPLHSTPTPLHSTPTPLHSTPTPLHSTPSPVHSTPTSRSPSQTLKSNYPSQPHKGPNMRDAYNSWASYKNKNQSASKNNKISERQKGKPSTRSVSNEVQDRQASPRSPNVSRRPEEEILRSPKPQGNPRSWENENRSPLRGQGSTPGNNSPSHQVEIKRSTKPQPERAYSDVFESDSFHETSSDSDDSSVPKEWSTHGHIWMRPGNESAMGREKSIPSPATHLQPPIPSLPDTRQPKDMSAPNHTGQEMQNQARGPDQPQEGQMPQRRQDMAQRWQEMAQRWQDMTQPKQDMAQPRQDMAQPKKDMAQPMQDMAQPKQDMAQRWQGMAQRWQDKTQQRQDMAQPRPDMAQPNKDMAQQRQDTGQPMQDMAQQRQDIGQPMQDMTQQRQDMAQPMQGMAQQRQDLGQPMQDMAQQRQDLSQPRQDLAQSGQDMAQPKQDMAQRWQGMAQRWQDMTPQRQDMAQPRPDMAQPNKDMPQQRQDTGQPMQDMTQQRQDMAQPMQGMAQQRQDLAQSGQDMAQPMQDMAQQRQDIGQPMQDMAQPKQDMAQRWQGMAQRWQDKTQQRQDMAQPRTDMAQPNKDMAQQRQDTGQPMQDMTQPMQGMTQPMQGMTQPMQGMTQPMQGMAQQRQDMGQPMQDMTQQRQDLSQPRQDLAQSGQDMAQPKQDMAQHWQGMAQRWQDMTQQRQDMAQPKPQKQDVVQPRQDMTQSMQDMTQQRQDLSQPRQDLAQRWQGMAQRWQDMAQQRQNMDQPRPDMVQPRKDMTQQDMSQPGRDMAQPKKDMALPRQDKAQPRQDMTQRWQGMAQRWQDMTQHRQNMDHPRADMVQPNKDMTHPKQDMAQPRPDMAHPKQDMTQPSQEMQNQARSPAQPKELSMTPSAQKEGAGSLGKDMLTRPVQRQGADSPPRTPTPEISPSPQKDEQSAARYMPSQGLDLQSQKEQGNGIQSSASPQEFLTPPREIKDIRSSDPNYAQTPKNFDPSPESPYQGKGTPRPNISPWPSPGNNTGPPVMPNFQDSVQTPQDWDSYDQSTLVNDNTTIGQIPGVNSAKTGKRFENFNPDSRKKFTAGKGLSRSYPASPVANIDELNTSYNPYNDEHGLSPWIPENRTPASMENRSEREEEKEGRGKREGRGGQTGEQDMSVGVNHVGEPLAASTPDHKGSTNHKSHRSAVIGDDLGSTTSTSYWGQRTDDNLHASLELEAILHFLNSAKPNKRLIGEVAYQLDRRILSYVFSINRIDHPYKRRFYGYTLQNIHNLIHRESYNRITGGLDDDIHDKLNYRLQYVLRSLAPLGYDLKKHALYSADLVNRYGLLPIPPNQAIADLFSIGNKQMIRGYLKGVTSTGDEKDVLTLFDCLALMAEDEAKALFTW